MVATLSKPTTKEISEQWSTIERTVSRTLTHLGIFPCRKGHALLRDAILYNLHNLYTFQTDFPKSLYKHLAEKHNCSEKTAASNIHSAISAAQNAGTLERFNKLLGANVIDEYSPLSNLQFISLAAQYCYYNEKG